MPRPAAKTSIAIGYTLIALGLASMALGAGWKHIVPARVFWTDDQARRYDAAYQAAHSESITPEGQPADTTRARRALEAMDRQLQRARAARDHGGRWPLLLGAGLAGGGLIVLRSRAAAN